MENPAPNLVTAASSYTAPQYIPHHTSGAPTAQRMRPYPPNAQAPNQALPNNGTSPQFPNGGMGGR